MENISIGCPISDEINPYHYEGELQPEELTIYRHEADAMIKLGKYGDFDFLTRVAFRPVKAADYRNETSYGQDIIEEVLSRDYVRIPDYRSIAYTAITHNGKYLIVDQSYYNFTYEGMRCWYGDLQEGISEVKIEKFQRYRDGGTTMFEFESSDGRHRFFCPSKLGIENKKQTLDDIDVSEMDYDEIYFIYKNLGIRLKNQ